MKKNDLCALLGVEYPIIQAPMAWVATAELAAAVSEAGGLGTIGPNAGMIHQNEARDIETSIRRFKEQIKKARSLTGKPFAANIPVGWGKQRIITDRLLDAALEERLPIAVVSMGASEIYTAKLKEAGTKVVHAVASVKHAKKAEADGVDVVVCEGYEGGGHLGRDELTTLVLVPQVADALKIPLIAGGGIVDGRGMAAALALGAQGVYVGTRFLATLECSAHPAVKDAIMSATDTSTIVFARKTGISRCWKNEYTSKHTELEAAGASFEALRNFERTSAGLGDWHRLGGALVAGNMQDGSLPMGAGAGMITDIISAGEVVRRLVREYDEAVKRLNT